MKLFFEGILFLTVLALIVAISVTVIVWALSSIQRYAPHLIIGH